ncbi:MAG: secretin and TonB N-terminal domain-containing protein, partial [Chitinophagaceae bacterium]|nr:secretin and TonB N-terminal domain-containing protein [Chitinophagaceae bacterium]
MKLALSFFVVVIMSIGGRTYGQGITLSRKKATIETIFNEIQKQSGYNFIYNDAWTENAREVSIDVENETVDRVLEICFKNQPFTYTITGKTISLKLRVDNTGSQPKGTLPIDVTGEVRNEKGELLEGITIAASDGSDATSTDSAGRFSLKSVPANITLKITGAAIEPYIARLQGNKTLAITVITKVNIIEEVIVSTGYQDIPKERATGSFVKINNQLYNRNTSPKILDRLDGISNGLLFDKRKATPSIQIRGLFTLTESISQPLIIVDNFPFEGSINNLNPNDVESVTILKDASATSIWGARA